MVEAGGRAYSKADEAYKDAWKRWKNGLMPFESEYFGGSGQGGQMEVSNEPPSLIRFGIKKSGTGFFRGQAYTEEAIDVTGVSTVTMHFPVFCIRATGTGYGGGGYFLGASLEKLYSEYDYKASVGLEFTSTINETDKVLKFDVSKLSGVYYIGLHVYCNQSNGFNITLSKIQLS